MDRDAMRKYLAGRCGGQGTPGMWGGGEVKDDSEDGVGVTDTPPENLETLPEASNSLYDPLQGVPHTLAAPSPLSSIVEASPPSTEGIGSAATAASGGGASSPSYTEAASGDKVAEAMAAQRRGDLIAGIGRSLQQIAQARATANGLKPDYSAMDSIASQGARDVSQAAAQRQAAIQDFLAKRRMGQEDTAAGYQAGAEARAQGEYDRKPLEAEKGREERRTELTARLEESRRNHDLAAQGQKDARAASVQAHADAVAARQAEVAAKAADKKDDYDASVKIPGLDVTPGFKPGKDTANKVRAAKTTHDDLNGALSELDRLHKEHGNNLIGGNAARQSQLVNTIKTKLKDMESLGALSGADYALLDAQIPDPTSLKSNLSGMIMMDNYGAKSGEFHKSLDRSFQSQVTNSGYQETGVAHQAPDVAAYAQKHGISYEQAAAVKAARGGK